MVPVDGLLSLRSSELAAMRSVTATLCALPFGLALSRQRLRAARATSNRL